MNASSADLSPMLDHSYSNTSTLWPPNTTDIAVVPSAATAPPGPSLGVRVTILAYCYILPVICVLGIIGNLMNVVTLASRRLRAVSYMYLRALAIADLLCMIFVLAFVSGEVLHQTGIAYLNTNSWYGFYQAHLMLSMINWALATGVYVVVALSLERYVSVVFPMHFRAWNSPQRAFRAIMFAYIVPFLFYIPYALARYSVGQKMSPDNRTIVYMAIDSDISKTFGWKIYKWTREGMLRFLPIVVLSVLNLQIILAFRKRQKMFARLTNKEKTNAARDDTLLYILGGIVIMFFVCNIPAAINLLFINETVKKRSDYQIFRAVANLLEITNHAAQFYIFCVCSTDYRVSFMEKFPFPCFRAYYLHKKRFRSLLRRTNNKDSSAGNFPNSMTNNNSAILHQQQRTGSLKSSGMPKSTTATLEAGSARSAQDINNLAEQETVDIQLASGEEDISSDESDVLLSYSVVRNSTEDGLNGTTYL